VKNKAITFFLLGTVLLIWGGIFLKVFATFFSQEKNAHSISIRKSLENRVEYEATMYSIKANYRDPFLGNSASIENESVSPPGERVERKEPARKVLPKIIEAPVDWSFVKYLGSIRNSGNGKKIALVSIRNQEMMIEEGMEHDGLKCLKYYRDSIIVIYQGKRACIKK